MTAENTLSKLIGSLIVIGLLGALIVFNPIFQGVLGGILWNRDFQKATLIEYYENNYADVCPSYRDASTWDRWFDSTTSRRSWCADYLDRL